MEAISLGVWDPPKYAVPRKLARKLVGGGTFFFFKVFYWANKCTIYSTELG